MSGETISKQRLKKNDLFQVPRSVPNSALKEEKVQLPLFKKKNKAVFLQFPTCLGNVNYRIYGMSESYRNARVAVPETCRGQPLLRKSGRRCPEPRDKCRRETTVQCGAQNR